MNRLFISLVAAALCHAPAIAADTPAPFSPNQFKLQNGRANEVMVLGSSHLSELAKPLDLANLSLLNARLAQWQPQAIGIEEISGLQCAFMRGYPQRYAGAVKSYCWDPAPATAATGLDVAQANARVDALLAAWPAAPTPGERRKLASLLLAAGERASALVQWLHLPEGERRAGDGLAQELVTLLEATAKLHDEAYQVAAVVAARSGHERVYPIDDQSATGPAGDEKASDAAIMKAWDNPYSAARRGESAALKSRLDTPQGVMALYRADNAAGAAERAFRSDFGAALEEPSPQRFGRGYVGYWETRNLRMAANIRDVMTVRPGIRMLVVVGASHKGYLEAYLDQMHDVRIVATDKVLRAQ
nr:DUF5694 domain-containing protein [uncultured Duganella sp.]